MAASFRDLLADIHARRRAVKKPRGHKWCTHCSRYHARSLTCDLYLGTRTTESGRTQKVWHH